MLARRVSLLLPLLPGLQQQTPHRYPLMALLLVGLLWPWRKV